MNNEALVRYRNDPRFHLLVRQIRYMLDGSPSTLDDVAAAVELLRSSEPTHSRFNPPATGAVAMREALIEVARRANATFSVNETATETAERVVTGYLAGRAIPAPEVLEDDAFLYACNACEWVGRGGETVAMKHGHPHHLCPECHETTEPYTADQVSRLINVPAPKVADTKIHAADEWAEEDGDVLWWRFPIVEPPHLGSPLETDWDEDYGYTHWTRFVVPEESSWPK